MDDELRTRLREAADAHQPDRARMLARVERGMAAPDVSGTHRLAPRPVLAWARIVGATAAVAGVMAVGGYAVASVVRDDTSEQRVAVSPTPEPSPSVTTSQASPSPETPKPSPSRSANASPKPSPTQGQQEPPSVPQARPAAGTEDGPLWSDGSIDPGSGEYWAQSDVTIKTRKVLASLTVELRVAKTAGVASTGGWRSLPEQDFTYTVEERDGFLVYRWTLKDGATVPVGEYVFAGQYNHERGGRDAGDDWYAATAEAGGERFEVRGDFAPVSDD
ncbi:hypothetical protein H1V43_00485 [Streptomyces sp. PSKA54]|uniref:Uncharacterized protein n=1 Tax=Streptomyces himalayensis subsp. aureolus TaxID=2758039 RepID=A0A7W2HDK0_9ACTN|nr:hypothetical protein [Streptomyces himalayensis]MBA4859877.1 hypothetical protein [Streptomyces himalayensis subsp. aureolus]